MPQHLVPGRYLPQGADLILMLADAFVGQRHAAPNTKRARGFARNGAVLPILLGHGSRTPLFRLALQFRSIVTNDVRRRFAIQSKLLMPGRDVLVGAAHHSSTSSIAGRSAPRPRQLLCRDPETVTAKICRLLQPRPDPSTTYGSAHPAARVGVINTLHFFRSRRH